jgi:D-glycero-beta-D-manno-heptose 1-phosphate adenylyltransferase
MPSLGKVVSLNELLPSRASWQAAGETLVFTNGVFDLLHLGHVRYLQEARSLGDVLVVGLNSDASTRRLKGPGRPLVPQTERAELLAALACVDHVVIFEGDTAEPLVEALRPEIYVKGGDYRAAGGQAPAGTQGQVAAKPLPEAAVVRRYGGRIVLLPYLTGHSTTELIERILQAHG